MTTLTTYQSMCTDALLKDSPTSRTRAHRHHQAAPGETFGDDGRGSCQQSSGQSTASTCQPSETFLFIRREQNSRNACYKSSSIHVRKKERDPIPLYFAWNRLDDQKDNIPVTKSDLSCRSNENDSIIVGQSVHREASQCQEIPQINNTNTAATKAAASHNFFVAPDLINTRPITTEYADQYRSWTIDANVAPKTVKSRKERLTNGRNNVLNETGTSLCLNGTTIVQSPRPQRSAVKNSNKLALGSTTKRISHKHCAISRAPYGLDIQATPQCTGNNIDVYSTPPKTTQRSVGQNNNAESNPRIDFKENICAETDASTSISVSILPPTPLMEKKNNNDEWFITSGNDTGMNINNMGAASTSATNNIDGKQSTITNYRRAALDKKRRDMPFWKQTKGSAACTAFGLHNPTTPSSQQRGKGRKAGSSMTYGMSNSCSSSSSSAAPKKSEKMLMTSRRGLSSTKLFPRLPNDPFSRRARTRKV